VASPLVNKMDASWLKDDDWLKDDFGAAGPTVNTHELLIVAINRASAGPPGSVSRAP